MKAKRHANPEKYNAEMRAWRKNNPVFHRKQSLKRNFGLTIEQYDAMSASQDNACAICRGHNKSGKRLAVDHNHATGQIRALLCSLCNTALGGFKDNPGLCRLGAEYLERWSA